MNWTQAMQFMAIGGALLGAGWLLWTLQTKEALIVIGTVLGYAFGRTQDAQFALRMKKKVAKAKRT